MRTGWGAEQVMNDLDQTQRNGEERGRAASKSKTRTNTGPTFVIMLFYSLQKFREDGSSSMNVIGAEAASLGWQTQGK